MSQADDEMFINLAHPQARLVKQVSTGGCKIESFVIKDGDTELGPWALSEAKAWRYACERLERAAEAKA